MFLHTFESFSKSLIIVTRIKVRAITNQNMSKLGEKNEILILSSHILLRIVNCCIININSDVLLVKNDKCLCFTI